MAKFVIFGLGMVGSSFLRIVHKNSLFDADNWYAIDKNPQALNDFEAAGGKKSHFIVSNIQQKQYDPIFSILEKGDYLLDFSSSQTNTDFLEICINKDIHYLSTSSLPYEPEGVIIHEYHDFCVYKEMKKINKPNGPTSIIEFGMNPGMVSTFMKQGIREIVKNDNTPFVVENREKLQNLISQNKFAEAAQMLEVEIVHISDIDTTETNFEPKENCVYSTWNVEAFSDETLASCEISLGTDINFDTFGNEIEDCSESDRHLILDKIPVSCVDQSFSPWGSFDGYIVPHEEIYSIGDFLTVRKNDKVTYKPSVYFVYMPSKIAVASLLDGHQKGFKGFEEYLIKPEDIAQGGEAVGIVLDGKNFETRYFGNKLVAPIENETPTILQVSASAYAAFRYMLDNPNEGFLFPEEVDDNKIVEYAKPVLKEYVSFTCPKLERTFFKQKFA